MSESTSVNLTKGGSVNLTKESPTALNKVMIGCGWDPATEGATMDADLSVFALTAENRVREKSDFVFFNNLNGKGIVHQGDNLTGDGDGDDEQIMVDLNAIHADTKTIDIIMNIYDAKSKGQDLSQLKNAFVRIVNQESGVEIAIFDISGGMSGDTLHFGTLVRGTEGWTFNAEGRTSTEGLGGLSAKYGV